MFFSPGPLMGNCVIYGSRVAPSKNTTLATVKAGYKYEIWVYSDKKVRVETKIYG